MPCLTHGDGVRGWGGWGSWVRQMPSRGRGSVNIELNMSQSPVFTKGWREGSGGRGEKGRVMQGVRGRWNKTSRTGEDPECFVYVFRSSLI